MLILALPMQLTSDDLTDFLDVDILHRLIRIGNLLNSPPSSIFFEYFMISYRFAARLSPRVFEIWVDKFPSKSVFLPFLKIQYMEIVPACLTLVHSALMDSFCLEGLDMMKELLNSITSCDKPEMIQHFIRLLFIGKPSIISLISRSKVTQFFKSFFYQCIQLCIPIRDRLNAQYLSSLMSLYLKTVQIDIKSDMDLPSLKKIFTPYLDTVYDLSDVNSSQRDSVFMVQLISTGVLRTSGCMLCPIFLHTFALIHHFS